MDNDINNQDGIVDDLNPAQVESKDISTKKAFWPKLIIGLILLSVLIVTGVIIFLFSRGNKDVLSDTDSVSKIIVDSPHKNYSYNYKGNLHAHSNYSVPNVNKDDGSTSSVDAAKWYIDNGFSFYAMTGHDIITPNPLPDNKNIVWMGPSLENELNPKKKAGSKLHIGMINLSESFYDKTTMVRKLSELSTTYKDSANVNVYGEDNGGKTAQSIMDAVTGGGGIVIINHPYVYTKPVPLDNDKPVPEEREPNVYFGQYGNEALEAAKSLNNITGMEIINNYNGNASNPVIIRTKNYTKADPFNYVKTIDTQTTSIDDKGTFISGKENIPVSAWDEMLINGKKVWGVANDDGHSNDARGGAFNIVNSNVPKATLTKEEIIKNIKLGNFYPSTPVYIKLGDKTVASKYYYDLKVTVTSDKDFIYVNASTTNGSAIRTVVGYNTGAMKESDSTGMSTKYKTNGYERYVRFEILKKVEGEDKDGKKYSYYKEVAWSQPVFINVLPFSVIPTSTQGFYNYEQGTIDSSNGIERNNDTDLKTRIRLSNPVAIDPSWKTLRFTSAYTDTIRIIVTAYDKSNKYLGHDGWHTFMNPYIYKIPYGTTKIQYAISYINDGPIRVADKASWFRLEASTFDKSTRRYVVISRPITFDKSISGLVGSQGGDFVLTKAGSWELWLTTVGSDESYAKNGIGAIKRYSLDYTTSKARPVVNITTGKSDFSHVFGHMNSYSFNQAGKVIVFGNGSGDYNLSPEFYVVYTDTINLSGVNRFGDAGLRMKKFDVPKYFGTKCNVIWTNLNNIAIMITNDGKTIRKIRLASGSEQLEYGTFAKGTSQFNYNGTYSVINTYEIQKAFDVVQGAIYVNGKIIIGLGHDQLKFAVIELLEDGSMNYKVYHDPSTANQITSKTSTTRFSNMFYDEAKGWFGGNLSNGDTYLWKDTNFTFTGPVKPVSRN